MRPRVRTARTGHKSVFDHIQNAVVVIIDVLFVRNAITISVPPEIVTVIEISCQKCRVTAIGGGIFIGVSQQEFTTIVAQSVDVRKIINGFMRCTIIQTVGADIGIRSAVAIGVVITKSAFGDVQHAVVVTVQV